MTAHTSEIHSTDRPLPCPTCGAGPLRSAGGGVGMARCESCEAQFVMALLAKDAGWYCYRRDAVLAYSTRCRVIRRIFQSVLGIDLRPWDLAGGCFALCAVLDDGREVMVGDGDGNLPDDERYMAEHGYTLCVTVAHPDDDDAPALYATSVAKVVAFVRDAMASPVMDFDTAEAAGLDGTLRSGEIAQQLARAATVTDPEPERVRLDLTPGALALLSALLDFNDDDDELAENSGASAADITALRDAVLSARLAR